MAGEEGFEPSAYGFGDLKFDAETALGCCILSALNDLLHTIYTLTHQIYTRYVLYV